MSAKSAISAIRVQVKSDVNYKIFKINDFLRNAETQDSVLGNSQSSLRDWQSSPYPTQDCRPGLLSAVPAGLSHLLQSEWRGAALRPEMQKLQGTG
jgi:hypothetical protein